MGYENPDMKVCRFVFSTLLATFFALPVVVAAEPEKLADFSLPIPGLSVEVEARFLDGAAIFRQRWSAEREIAEGKGDPTFSGLGPIYNARACAACHVNAWRGRPPVREGEQLSSLLIRLSVPGKDVQGSPRLHPAYGDQLQNRAIDGVPPEGHLFVEYSPVYGSYGDGTAYQLRRPVYVFYRMSHLQLGALAMYSPRVAPALPGSGLIEAIPEADILTFADEQDKDDDGISGRPNLVWDPESSTVRLGRFGWKANQVGLHQQTAAAAFGDMGLTSKLYPGPTCEILQRACRAAEKGTAALELSTERLAALTAYLRYLEPPVRRRRHGPEVVRGEVLFHSVGCDACHTPQYLTATNAEPALSGRYIQPYSDFLLHDMGDGLADRRPEFLATGREWRTPPLWGLGSLKAASGHEFLLHDGRARGPAEAILWHGGEAVVAREAFRNLSASERGDLLTFLRSL